jgi:hypothetical protein
MNAVGIPDDANASIYGVTNNAVWLAWDAFFVTLKGAGLLAKHYYIRGMTGAVANAANYKFNAINPLDTDAAFRAVYFGGVTFTANGTEGNGSNGYANSFFNDQTAGVATNDFGITMYSRTNSVRNETAMGVVAISGTYIAMQPRFDTSPNGDRFWCYDNSSFSGNVLTRSDGAFTVTREPATANTQRAYRNGVQFNQRTSFAPTVLSNLPIFELGLNYLGSLLGPSNRQFSYFAAHRGMTIAETAIYHTAIENLQVALNRQA